MTRLGEILPFGLLFVLKKIFDFHLNKQSKSWFDVDILSFKVGFVVGILAFEISFVVDILAFFGSAIFLATFWENWATFFLNRLVTLMTLDQARLSRDQEVLVLVQPGSQSLRLY